MTAFQLPLFNCVINFYYTLFCFLVDGFPLVALFPGTLKNVFSRTFNWAFEVSFENLILGALLFIIERAEANSLAHKSNRQLLLMVHEAMLLTTIMMSTTSSDRSSLKQQPRQEAEQIKVSKEGEALLTSHRHVARFVRELKIWRIPGHLTAVGTGRFEV
jgi:hypothetical protein